MNIPTDIISLKEQGVEDRQVIELIELKGAKIPEIEEKLQEFYLNKNATQINSRESKSSSFPLIQLLIVIVLLIISLYLGWIIWKG